MRKEDNLQLNIKEKESTTAYIVSLILMLALSYVILLVPTGNAQTLLNYGITQICYLIMPFIYLKWRGASYTSVVPVKGKINPLGLLLTLPIALGAFLQNTIISVLFNNLLILMGVTPSVSLPLTDTPLNITLAILTVVVLPAISEEFLFRGVIASSYKQHGVMKACFLSSLIFALSHFNPAQLVHQFILGFILCATVLTTGNIWYAVIIHAINNLVALFIGDVIPAFNGLATLNATNALILLAMCVVGAIILILSFIFFNRACAKDNLKISGNPLKVLSKTKAPAYYENNGEKLSYITIGFLVFLAVMSILTVLVQALSV